MIARKIFRRELVQRQAFEIEHPLFKMDDRLASATLECVFMFRRAAQLVDGVLEHPVGPLR